MSGAAHRIRRHEWRVHAPTVACAFSTRMQLRAEMDSLSSVFAEAFDAVAGDDEVLRIPRLSLEIALPAEGGVPGSFARLLHAELARALRHRVPRESSSACARRITRAASVRQALLHYLATGRVPWHESDAVPGTVARALEEEARALASDPEAFEAVLPKSPFAHRLAACFRWLQLVEADDGSRMLASLSRPGNGDDADVAALRAAIAGSPAGAPYEALRLRALALAFESLDAPACAASSTRHVLRQELGREASFLAAKAIDVTDPRKGAMAKREVTREVAGEPRVPRRVDRAPAIAPDSWPVEEEEGFTGHDAGLVLLHPYLPRLFEATAIGADDAREIPEPSLPRAAALLHYLLRGEDEIHEFELVVIKVLLGIAPDRMVLVGDGLLAAADREEADALLAAAIDHWPGLGSTSRAGLRQAFLQRHGRLRDAGAAWTLQVETSPFDVLLARIPWTLGTVKLPWMTRPIFIDWPTR